MRKLHNFKQVVRHTCHQHTCAVLIEKGEGQRLNMGEHIPAHICLHQRSHPMADNRDQILKPRP